MPISILTSDEAQSNLRRNRSSIWPDGRKSRGRLGEYTVCEIKPRFSFSHEDLIFTTGSCFARNIEKKLGELGFNLPMLNVDTPEEERVSGLPNEIVNKYTTAAVLNELRWGLGLATFPPDALIEMDGGLVHDPHLHPQTPPVTRERALQRREAIHQIVARLPECRIFIMTLGLVEAWFDEKTGLYLNGAPPRGAFAAQPDRFTLRRQTHAEILADLQAIHAVVSEHGHPEFRMILSVSPVPFKATYAGQDAIVANTYSKSVLRAAAEEFVQSHDNVDYFPSYEMVTLSDRSAAYWDDNIHVQDAMVGRIMNMAVASYVPGSAEVEAEFDIASVGPKPRDWLAAGLRYRGQGNYGVAVKLFQLIEDNSVIEAAGTTPQDFYLLYGTTLARAGRNAEAEPHLARAVALSPTDARATYKLGLISARLRRPYAVRLFELALKLDPDSVQYLSRLALELERSKRWEEAEGRFREALALEPEYEEAKLGLARVTRASRASEKTAA